MKDKKLIYLFIILITILLGSNFGNDNNPPTVMPLKSHSEVKGADISTQELFLVKRVIDGDTIELSNGARVRYIGIDTPEIHDPRVEVQCFGKEAMEENQRLVEGKIVRLDKDISNLDKYGRLLRYVYLNDELINRVLVENGYARAVSYPPDIAKQEIFKLAERAAREAGKGLWGKCAD